MGARPVVDHAHAAAFTPATRSPADLPQAARSGNQIAGLRIGRKTQLQKPVVLRTQKLPYPSGEDCRFLNQHRTPYAIGVLVAGSVRDLTRAGAYAMGSTCRQQTTPSQSSAADPIGRFEHTWGSRD